MRSGSRKRRRPGLLLVLVGFVSVVASVVILAWPVHCAVALAALVGGFAVEYGILLAVLALRLRNAAQATTEPFPAPAPLTGSPIDGALARSNLRPGNRRDQAWAPRPGWSDRKVGPYSREVPRAQPRRPPTTRCA